MTELNGWEQQPGGLWLKVSPYNNNDTEDRDAAIRVMRDTVQKVAQTHGAEFNEKGFRENVRAITSGDIEVDLYLAKWEICEPKVYLGAALNWETYAFTPDGKLANSIYTEDVCLLKGPLRELIRSKPEEKDFPKGSLVKYLERIRFNQMRNDGVIYRFGEVDPDNTAMLRQLNENGALMGIGPDSAVLEFTRIPVDLKASWFTPTSEPIPIMRHGVRNEKNFYVQWKMDGHDIRFLVTKGRATALGRSRADIRPWHNGNLPEQDILESVIGSALVTIKQEIDDREWGSGQKRVIPAPQLPLHEEHSRMKKALYGAAGDEVATSASEQPTTFSKPLTDAHVFIQSDVRMLEGFKANAARQRLFGNKPTIPGVNVIHESARLTV